MRTRRSDCGNVSGCSTNVLKVENSAVFAPMPRARVRTATAVKPGVLQRDRMAIFIGQQWVTGVDACVDYIRANDCMTCAKATTRALRIALQIIGIWTGL